MFRSANMEPGTNPRPCLGQNPLKAQANSIQQEENLMLFLLRVSLLHHRCAQPGRRLLFCYRAQHCNGHVQEMIQIVHGFQLAHPHVLKAQLVFL